MSKTLEFTDAFEFAIHLAYKNTNRSNLWLAACLMQEAGELAEHTIKKDGYNKEYEVNDLLSEAGDVLNFLTAILQAHDLTLKDAMSHNIDKLEKRGWI